GHFLRIAGQSDRNVADDGSTEGGVTESLAFMNGKVAEKVTGRDAVLMKNAIRRKTAADTVEALYLGFLGREPTSDEARLAESSITNGMDAADLAWALFNCREFIFIQ
ncbi:MAG: hypothetical protein N2C14_07655, partial [Planctomycetales bacterium]